MEFNTNVGQWTYQSGSLVPFNNFPESYKNKLPLEEGYKPTYLQVQRNETPNVFTQGITIHASLSPYIPPAKIESNAQLPQAMPNNKTEDNPDSD